MLLILSLFRPSRQRREGPDAFLVPKMMLFMAGAIFGVVGMATERNWVIWLAFITLGLGLLLRLLGPRLRD